MISALILTLSLSFCPPSGPVVPDDTLQLVVGIAPSWDARNATIYRFERKPGKPWKRVGKKWSANLGKNGLAAGRGLVDWCGPDDGRKAEGDKKSPAGVFRLGPSYGWGKGLKNAPRGKMKPITKTTVCVSDPASKSYNRIVDTEKVEDDWDWAGFFRRPRNEVKNRTIMIGVNGGADPDADPPVAGEGSCVLFHRSRGPKHPTIGCTALPTEAMDALVAWLSAKKRPVYVLMTEEQYEELRAEQGSGLPKLR
jgi:L,D-peptidoglycan transpeptidase YkuD (ErfK/YbiS/YcfS/YnhG family)